MYLHGFSLNLYEFQIFLTLRVHTIDNFISIVQFIERFVFQEFLLVKLLTENSGNRLNNNHVRVRDGVTSIFYS